jgi:hypothetical protein
VKWEADQRIGFFGWNVDGQFRWRGVVDLDAAHAAVGDVLERWWAVLQWPDAQPFSGGVLDAWPQRLSEGLALCRVEWRAIQDFVRTEKEARRG